MLPETWIDRVLALGTLLAGAALVVVVLTHREDLRVERPVSAAATSIEQDLPRPATEAARTRPAAARPRTTPAAPAPRPAGNRAASAPAPRPRVRKARPLEIVAARGPSWLEVRERSAAGTQLYYGTLGEGETQVLPRLPVWIRTGALENLELRLGGAEPLPLPPSDGGVAVFVVSRDGITDAPTRR